MKMQGDQDTHTMQVAMNYSLWVNILKAFSYLQHLNDLRNFIHNLTILESY